MLFNCRQALERVKTEKAAVVRTAEEAEREAFNQSVREANRARGKRFPTIRKVPGEGDDDSSSTARPAHGPVTFRELSLGDKERILELLFARINNQQRELRNAAAATAAPAAAAAAAAVHAAAGEDEVDRLASKVPNVLTVSMAGVASSMRPEIE